MPDSYPPFYQPQGASHTGGSFADAVCVCNTPGNACQPKADDATAAKDQSDEAKAKTPAELAPVRSAGCRIAGA